MLCAVDANIFTLTLKSSICPLRGLSEKYRPFWIFGEPVAWPWCTLPASQRRHYCAFVNSHSLVGLVSRQWDALNWVCVLCDHRIHSDRESKSASSRQCSWPFYSSRTEFFFFTKHHINQVCQSPYSPDWSPCEYWLFLNLKSPLKGGDLWMRQSRSTQGQSTASHCRLTSLMGERLFTDEQ